MTEERAGYETGSAVELKTWWVVMKPQRWILDSSLPFPLELDPNVKMRRYLPVYDSREEALADFPDGPIQECREYEEQPTQ